MNENDSMIQTFGMMTLFIGKSRMKIIIREAHEKVLIDRHKTRMITLKDCYKRLNQIS